MSFIYASSDKNTTLSSICRKLNIHEADLVSAEQVHADRLAFVTRKNLGQQLKGVDTLITNEKGVPLAIRTADCAPILIYDPQQELLALIHAGRKGTELQITRKTVLILKESFDSNPKDLIVKIGPCISPCCYPTDIRQANLQQLKSVGVLEDNIEVSPECTCCNTNKYYSYRGDGPKTSRNFLVAML